MGNRERIVAGTMELMNKYGSSVGTTQLAEHLNISPGNLYYHFRNREEILHELLTRLESDLEAHLSVTPDTDVSAKELARYLSGGGDILWRYRFFFSAPVELVLRDAQLSKRYREFSGNGIRAVSAIIENVVKVAPSERTLQSTERLYMAENMWVLWTSWPRFYEVSLGREAARDDIDRGQEHIALLLKPYLAKAFFDRVMRALRDASRAIAQ